MKIAMFDVKPYDVPGFEKYGAESGIEFKFYDTRLGEDTAALARGCDGVCLFVNDTLNAAVIDQLTEYGVRVAALRCAGYNNVDLEHAFGRLHVFHVPAYSPHAVAEHAMALLLTSIRRVHKAYIRTKDFNFSLNGLTGFELHGKTVGIVGTGRIGRVFADICRGFGMKIIGYDKFPAPDARIEYVPLDELFEKSDVISLHCPLTKETHHLVNHSSVERMKKGVVIVNTSRGALIDSDALLEGIKERKIGAACLDVYEEEGDIFFRDFSGHIIADDTLARLITMPNVIVTSHQAFLTEEALDGIAAATVKNLLDFERDGMGEHELCYRCGRMEECRRERKTKCF
ncbi:MAG: 2-hydroxyacid dehydrogenase [Clostridia bacterium]|nr:2-hydroxyacid dehydrogenase [Clostridia bacterium]